MCLASPVWCQQQDKQRENEYPWIVLMEGVPTRRLCDTNYRKVAGVGIKAHMDFVHKVGRVRDTHQW